jgi:hypothetical protein
MEKIVHWDFSLINEPVCFQLFPHCIHVRTRPTNGEGLLFFGFFLGELPQEMPKPQFLKSLVMSTLNFPNRKKSNICLLFNQEINLI